MSHPFPPQIATQGKVFGIGLSRTGTKSLSAALTLLGFRTAHFPQLRDRLAQGPHWFDGNFTIDCLAGLDAAVDLPIPVFFPQLDERYPGSKFILTVREPESWLASVERHLARRTVEGDPYRRTVRLAMYGTYGFSRARFLYVMESHRRTVTWYFRRRPDDLLVVDFCAGAGWEPLCSFLGRPSPAVEFPHVSTG